MNTSHLLLLVGTTALGFLIAYLAEKSKRAVLHQRLDEQQRLHQQCETEQHAVTSKNEELTRASRQTTDRLNQLQIDFNVVKRECDELRQKRDHWESGIRTYENEIATLRAQNKAADEKLATQALEMEERSKRFHLEFESLANKILEDKSTRFTQQNEKNLQDLLKPLRENIKTFEKKVEDAYNTEAKERFSLGKEVEKLMHLNQRISEEAKNLTRALKGSSKTQGDWGQMILENILENSGLEKDREYFVQGTLRDQSGNTIKNERGQRMQPDVIIAYPDDRKVIIDAKVSLNAYTRFTETDDADEQKKHLNDHLTSIRKHIDELSDKNYQAHTSSLDFVMMFVPNEPAYLEALKHDKTLWDYAYRKRILLISPTNLIAALKMIEDLWKREYQNQNALEIAERGAKLYDKFVGFVENLDDVGKHLDNATSAHQRAFKQLSEGKGNLIRQTEQLRALGVKPKKALPASKD
jgi:DNA recombination protein RmuC